MLATLVRSNRRKICLTKSSACNKVREISCEETKRERGEREKERKEAGESKGTSESIHLNYLFAEMKERHEQELAAFDAKQNTTADKNSNTKPTPTYEKQTNNLLLLLCTIPTKTALFFTKIVC